MLTKILTAVQNQLKQYPGTVDIVKSFLSKSSNWLSRQAFAQDVQAFWRQVEFNVNLGSFPELDVQNFRLSKASGSLDILGSTARIGGFTFTLAGLVESAKAKTAAKRSDAKAKADIARQRADEAQRLAQEAAEAARVAESEASVFEGVVGRL